MYKDIYDAMCDDKTGALATLARMAMREAAIPVSTGQDDARDAYIVLESDGSLAVRLMGTGEHLRDGVSLARVKHWCAAETLGEVYIDWAVDGDDSDEYIQGIVDEAMDELRRLAQREAEDE